jgi:HlyD family secretion protein
MPSVDDATIEASPPVIEPELSPVPSGDLEPARAPSPYRNVLLWMGLGLAVIAGTLLFRGHRAGSDATHTYTVERGTFIRTLRLKGTTEALQSRSVTAPVLAGAQMDKLVITRLALGGAKVRKGDFLAEFDRQLQLKGAIDKQADYQKLASQAEESQAQEDAARAKDETELRQAENALKKAELEMRRNEILSRIDVEKNQESLEEAKAALLQLRQTFDLKRRAARAAIRILQIQSEQARGDMVHAQSNADKMLIHSPIDGVVVLQAIWKQGVMNEVQEGDPVWTGVSFLEVVDTSVMQVRVKVNQQDLPDLKIGQVARVRLDAYPEIVFPAKLDQLAPVGAASDFSPKLHSFMAIFSIQGNDTKLMPDLSAAVDVELDRENNVLTAPRESIIAQGQDYFAWVKTRLGTKKQKVAIATRDDMEVVIQSGLNPGDVIERNPLDPVATTN